MFATGSDRLVASSDGWRTEVSVNCRHDWFGLDISSALEDIEVRLNEHKLLPWSTGLSLKGSLEGSSTATLPSVHVNVDLSPGTNVHLPLGGKELHRVVASIFDLLGTNSVGAEAMPKPIQRLPKRRIFTDDLRTNPSFAFSSYVPTDSIGVEDVSMWLPMPYEVIFADCDQFAISTEEEQGGKVWANMAWTYPEPRMPLRLRVMPVPLLYNNDGETDPIEVSRAC